MKSIEEIKVFPDKMQTMEDFQKFHRWLDERKHFDEDILFNMVLLSGEVGEVAQVIKQVRKKAHQLQEKQGPAAALDTALAEYRDDLGDELADCLAYIFKLANYMGIDMQEAYLRKMARNMERTW